MDLMESECYHALVLTGMMRHSVVLPFVIILIIIFQIASHISKIHR